MPLMTLNVIFAVLMLPFNLYCSFWLIKIPLNMTGTSFRKLLEDFSGVTFTNTRHGTRKRQRALFYYLAEKTGDPKKAMKIMRTYMASTVPGLAAFIFAQYIAVSTNPNKLTYALIGNCALLIINLALLAAGKIYSKNHPLDEKTAEKLNAEKEKNSKKRVSNIIAYTIVGGFFLTIIVGFILEAGNMYTMPSDNTNQSVGTSSQSPQVINYSTVDSLLSRMGFSTGAEPSYGYLDDRKLLRTVVGRYEDAVFEFYEYTDSETTDLIYNSISYDIAPNLEFKEKEQLEKSIPGDGKMFTFTQDGITYYALYRSNTAVYAFAPENSSLITDVLYKVGYITEI